MIPVLVIWEARPGSDGQLDELLRAAAALGTLTGRKPDVTVVLAGRDGTAAAGRLAGRGLGVEVLNLPENGSWDLIREALASLAAEFKARALIFSHTAMSREVAPASGMRLGFTAISNVSAIRRETDALIFSRPVLDNTRVQEVSLDHDAPVVMTLAPGSLDCPLPDEELILLSEGTGRVRETNLVPSTGVRRLSVTSFGGRGKGELADAPVVVAVGRGIGEKENLKLAKDFCNAMPNAVLAASRPLVDQGWMPYRRQVGITGATVSPDLYIALGISGSSQHLAGMAGSRWVVSVNKNPDAPICRHSDLSIEADVVEFIEAALDKK